MCSTCHVCVDPDWIGRIPAPSATELEMSECTAADRLDNSRLPCQIKVSEALDGLVIRLPQTAAVGNGSVRSP